MGESESDAFIHLEDKQGPLEQNYLFTFLKKRLKIFVCKKTFVVFLMVYDARSKS